MEITYKRNDKDIKKIDEIKTGECFIFDKSLCIKVDVKYHEEYFSSCIYYPNIALSLDDGLLFGIEKGEKVKIVSVSATVHHD